jgi:hypothetical protein
MHAIDLVAFVLAAFPSRSLRRDAVEKLTSQQGNPQIPALVSTGSQAAVEDSTVSTGLSLTDILSAEMVAWKARAEARREALRVNKSRKRSKHEAKAPQEQLKLQPALVATPNGELSAAVASSPLPPASLSSTSSSSSAAALSFSLKRELDARLGLWATVYGASRNVSLSASQLLSLWRRLDRPDERGLVLGFFHTVFKVAHTPVRTQQRKVFDIFTI